MAKIFDLPDVLHRGVSIWSDLNVSYNHFCRQHQLLCVHTKTLPVS